MARSRRWSSSAWSERVPARILPETVRDEALEFTSVGADPLAAPLHTMRLRHQTAELLRKGPVVADLAPEA